MTSAWARGARQALPVVLGYLPVGFAFGVLVVHNGMPAWMAVLTSVIVYAGSSQLIAAGMLESAVAPGSIIVTTFVVNLRHMLMSASLAPWLSSMPRSWLALFSLELTDETFALHSQTRQAGTAPVAAELIACNVTAQAGWVAGTALGALSGNLLGDTSVFGLDFTLAAMFIALLVPQCRDRLHLIAGLAAAGVSVGLTLLGAGRIAVVAATVLTAVTAGLLLHYRERPPQPGAVP